MALKENEQGGLQGGLAGAGTGAAIGAAAAPATFGTSIAVGALIGGAIGYFGGSEQADAQRRTRIDAQKKAEYARRRQLIQEYGAKQQADQLALSGSKNPTGGNGNNAGASALTQQGLIGASIPASGAPSISGTF